MKIVFFTFYYPPDLCAGSFRAIALTRALAKKLAVNDELHVITTHPNRYASHLVEAKDVEVDGRVVIHRIAVPAHNGGMLFQVRTFAKYAISACKLCWKLKPDFLIGTTSRLMTGVLTWFSARLLRRDYFIDLRDIFSETISDLFYRKSVLLSFIVRHTFLFLEKKMLESAAGVNIVSEGFSAYFQAQKIDTTSWFFYPNGVDQEFIDFTSSSPSTTEDVKTVLYAGNIGSGQGLETIIPATAKLLGDRYRFIVVGDGGTITLLENAIQREGVRNVELLAPVSRDKLIEYYQKADVLFLHLNNVPAFRRVLPSKIFEYTALGKPIVAGLNGYSAQFLQDNVPHACLFDPGNYRKAKTCILGAATSDVSDAVVNDFVSKYSRESIMEKMAGQIMDITGRCR